MNSAMRVASTVEAAVAYGTAGANSVALLAAMAMAMASTILRIELTFEGI